MFVAGEGLFDAVRLICSREQAMSDLIWLLRQPVPRTTRETPEDRIDVRKRRRLIDRSPSLDLPGFLQLSLLTGGNPRKRFSIKVQVRFVMITPGPDVPLFRGNDPHPNRKVRSTSNLAGMPLTPALPSP